MKGLSIIQATPRFGCRMFAKISNPGNVTNTPDTLLQDCLTTGENSFKHQSEKREASPRDGVVNPYHLEDLMGSYHKGNPHGWGLLGYEDTLFQKHNTKAAHTDPKFEDAVEGLAAKNPAIAMAHIRLAKTEKYPVTMENSHPFVYQNWSFMHNGSVKGALTPQVQAQIHQTFGPGSPKGQTTSESAFYYFLSKLQQQYGSVDSKQIGVEKTRQVFAESIRELLHLSKPEFKDLDGNIFGLHGQVKTCPACNFILSDGESLFAFANGRKLHVGLKTHANDEQEYLLSSEPIQPRRSNRLVNGLEHTIEKTCETLGISPKNPVPRFLHQALQRLNQCVMLLTQTRYNTIQWLEIPEQHLLTLTKSETGKIEPVLMPLDALVPPKETEMSPPQASVMPSPPELTLRPPVIPMPPLPPNYRPQPFQASPR